MKRHEDLSLISKARIAALAALTLSLIASLAIACATPAEKPGKEEKNGPRHVYKDIKPEVYDMPAAVREALPGLLEQNKIFVYREISPTVNLVAYAPEYSKESAAKMIANAFLALREVPDLREDIDFWIVQVQPEPKKAAPHPEEIGQKADVIVWGVKPSEVDRFAESGDLKLFLETSEYLLVDDVIIQKGPQRLAQFPDLKPESPPLVEDGDTSGGSEKIEPAPPGTEGGNTASVSPLDEGPGPEPADSDSAGPGE